MVYLARERKKIRVPSMNSSSLLSYEEGREEESRGGEKKIKQELGSSTSHLLCVPSYPEVFVQCSGYYGDDGILPQGLQPHGNVWEGMHNFLQKVHCYCVWLEVNGTKCKVQSESNLSEP